MFRKCVTSFAHVYTTEMCISKWIGFHSLMAWAPNEVTNEEKCIREWRDRAIYQVKFQHREIEEYEDLCYLGVPLQDTVKSTEDGKLLVKIGYYPLWPH